MKPRCERRSGPFGAQSAPRHSPAIHRRANVMSFLALAFEGNSNLDGVWRLLLRYGADALGARAAAIPTEATACSTTSLPWSG
jgi:hypothetical protein